MEPMVTISLNEYLQLLEVEKGADRIVLWQYSGMLDQRSYQVIGKDEMLKMMASEVATQQKKAHEDVSLLEDRLRDVNSRSFWKRLIDAFRGEYF